MEGEKGPGTEDLGCPFISRLQERKKRLSKPDAMIGGRVEHKNQIKDENGIIGASPLIDGIKRRIAGTSLRIGGASLRIVGNQMLGGVRLLQEESDVKNMMIGIVRAIVDVVVTRPHRSQIVREGAMQQQARLVHSTVPA